MTVLNDLPADSASPRKHGADGAFFAVVRPISDVDATDADLRELRAIADVYATRNSRHWLRAVALLRDLDGLDRQQATGVLDGEAYARLRDDRLKAARMEEWLTAAGLARLVDRIITYRQAEKGHSP